MLICDDSLQHEFIFVTVFGKEILQLVRNSFSMSALIRITENGLQIKIDDLCSRNSATSSQHTRSADDGCGGPDGGDDGAHA